MKSACSNCGGELVNGNALGACTRCGHSLTGALWTLEPPSQRRISPRPSSGDASPAWRLGAQVLAGVLAGCVASAILFGLIRAEQRADAEKNAAAAGGLAERSQTVAVTRQHAQRPGSSTGLSPSKQAAVVPAGFTGNAPLLHANAPARALGALADTDGGDTH